MAGTNWWQFYHETKIRFIYKLNNLFLGKLITSDNHNKKKTINKQNVKSTKTAVHRFECVRVRLVITYINECNQSRLKLRQRYYKMLTEIFFCFSFFPFSASYTCKCRVHIIRTKAWAIRASHSYSHIDIVYDFHSTPRMPLKRSPVFWNPNKNHSNDFWKIDFCP